MPTIKLTDGRTFYIDKRKMQILDFCINAVTKRNTSTVTIYDGRSGMGKSTMAIQDAFYCDKSESGFGLDKIYFTPEEFLEGLANAEPFSYHLYDEAMILSSRASMSKLNQTMVQMMSMIRSKRIMVGFCINSVFDLDRNLALSRADFLFHCYGRNITDRGRFAGFYKGNQGEDKIKLLYLIGKKYYSYSKPRANCIGRFSKRFLVNPMEYDLKKQEGIKKAIKKTSEPTTKRWIYQLIYNLRYKMNLSNQDISKMSGADDETIRVLSVKAINMFKSVENIANVS